MSNDILFGMRLVDREFMGVSWDSGREISAMGSYFRRQRRSQSRSQLEALHVIEGSTANALPNAHGRRLLLLATNDPHAKVRYFAETAIKKRMARRKRAIRSPGPSVA
ncbi:MAG: hypothetical protein HOL51_04555 [Gemmatimonadetes bacterium]|jgi:hypothetical protein|nr:hypothetical protein [Gemmatimonadota bacterium]MBT5325376.1 hypothetical protein [Gemmatimonadota bacterium]MBT5447677.1 hypothetical protein [Gemmatimonadota bacterium]MBT5800552.1 hypothetical protein [Gemmatimonadota bacterium]MBT6622749.1 hypothetical protein [Gemmatimonadota bacterium]